MVSSGESWVIDGYPLVNIQKTMERSSMLLMGKLTKKRLGHFSIANCNKLPEGISYIFHSLSSYA
jgi:hypothetical protein